MKKITLLFALIGLVIINALGDPPPGSKIYSEPVEILEPSLNELDQKGKESQQAMADAAAQVEKNKTCDSLKQQLKDAGCKTCGQKKYKKPVVAKKQPAPKPVAAKKPTPCVGCAEPKQQDCSEKAIFIEPVTPCSLAGYFKTNCCADCGEISMHCKVTEETLISKIEEATSVIWLSDQKDNDKLSSHILQSKVVRYSFKPDESFYYYTVENCTGELVKHSIGGTWDNIWLYRGRPWFHSLYGPLFKEGEDYANNGIAAGSDVSKADKNKDSDLDSNSKSKGTFGFAWFKDWGWKVLLFVLLAWILYLLLRTRWTQKDEVELDKKRWETNRQDHKAQYELSDESKKLIEKLKAEDKQS